MNLPGASELLIPLVIILLLFGAKKLPEIARSMGKAKNEFKKGLQEDDSGDASSAQKAPAESSADEK